MQRETERTVNNGSRVFSIACRLCIVGAAWLSFDTATYAQTEQDDLLGGLIEELGASDKVDAALEKQSDLRQRLLKTVSSMKSVSVTLVSGRVSDGTLNQQSAILADIDSLIEDLQTQQAESGDQQTSNTLQKSKARDSAREIGESKTDASDESRIDDSSRMDADSKLQAKTPSSSGSSIGNDPSQAGEVTGVSESGAEGNATSIGMPQQIWGRLPEKVREQARAITIENFSKGYRKAIQEYYRRLAEEQ